MNFRASTVFFIEVVLVSNILLNGVQLSPFFESGSPPHFQFNSLNGGGPGGTGTGTGGGGGGGGGGTSNFGVNVIQQVACVHTCLCSYSRYNGVTVKCVGDNDTNGNGHHHYRPGGGQLPDIQRILAKLPSNTRNLYLLYKRLEGLPKDSLKGLERLRDLYLSHNHLTDYESWSRAMDYHTASALSHLSLSHNKLQTIWSRAFRFFTMLHSLDVSANSISKIDREAFIGLESLLILDLRNNSLTSLTPKSFLNLHTLQQLFLEYNKIESIESGSFRQLRHLQTLSLVGNKLKIIGAGMFTGLYRLQQLHLSNNYIDKVTSKAIEDVSNLTEIWLDGNQLTTLESTLRPAFQRMNYGPVNLGHNPFVCDCNLLWLASWIRQQQIVTVGSDVTAPYPECLAPNQHYGKFVHNVPFQDFQCNNSSYHPQPCSWISSENETLTNNCSQLSSSLCPPQHGDINATSCLCDTQVPTCYVCPAGSYGQHKADANEIDCSSCPTLKGSYMGILKEEKCQCMPGFYANSSTNGSCTACPIGYYKSELGSHACKKCLTGSVTLRSGATSCECLPGFQLNRTGICEPCPEGTYKAHAGPHRCRSCPDYSKSPSRSVSVDQCRCLYAQARMGMLSSPHKVCLGSKESLNQINLESPFHEKGIHPPPTNADIYTIIIILLSVTLLTLTSLSIMVVAQKFGRRNLTKHEKMSEAKKAQMVQICISQPEEDAWLQTNLSSWEIPRECLTLGHLLGQGAFGQVFQAVLCRESGISNVAVKCCRDGLMPEEQEALWTELKLLIYVGKHQNIVNLIGTVFQQGSLMLVLEYATHGDLLTFLRSKTNTQLLPPLTPAPQQQQQQQQETQPTTTTTSSYMSPKNNSLRERLNVSMIPNVLYEPSPPSEPHNAHSNGGNRTPHSYNRQQSGPTRSSSTSSSPLFSNTTINSSKTTISTLLTTTITSNDYTSIEDRLLLSIAWQITKGMRHLEQLKCIHRDLAARNILLAQGMVAKISDFGLAREAYESGYYFRQSRGRLPFKWMALETLLQGQFTNKSDVWSFGIVLWEMMTLGANPYPGVPLNSLMDLLVSGYRMPKPENCPENVYKVMKSCWKECPSDRLTFNELCDEMEQIVQQVTNQDYIVIETSEIPFDDQSSNEE